ncbi:MAG: PadR family transcriptional regulator [Pseudonocardiaceae bacterium]|nr:PadR family transcriptional regulator [Pseudonocardiaceae bacterium]
MSKKRKVANPLALAVLGLLVERPMHPYEMSRTMRERHKEASIKLNYGSLYSVVDQLQRHELIEPQETVRDGRRPERTVYGLTAAGRTEFEDWLGELLRTPAKEYPQFEAGLSLLPGLSPETVVTLLEERAALLREAVATTRARLDEVHSDVPRLFLIEVDYEIWQQESELAFVEKLIADIKNDTLDGMHLWRDEEAWEDWYANHTSTSSWPAQQRGQHIEPGGNPCPDQAR